MDLVEFAHEVFQESFVEVDEPHVLLNSTTCCLITPHYLGLQQHILVVTNFVLQIFAHQVSQERADLDFHFS